MTNEEAKKIIFNQWQSFLEHNIDYAGISEAYKMAIKALEQQTCEDCVSRQALDEKISNAEPTRWLTENMTDEMAEEIIAEAKEKARERIKIYDTLDNLQNFDEYSPYQKDLSVVIDYIEGLEKGIEDLKEALEQQSITWIVGKDNAQVAVRNMPIDKMQKICAIIGDEDTSWIPVSERLPESNKDVFISNGTTVYVGWIDSDDGHWRIGSDYRIDGILAWMPLPESYRESEDKE